MLSVLYSSIDIAFYVLLLTRMLLVLVPLAGIIRSEICAATNYLCFRCCGVRVSFLASEVGSPAAE